MPHDAVLLAAGGSTRLKRPKQLLTRQGTPLVRYVAELLLSTSPDRLVIITGGSAEAVALALQGLPVDICYNPLWSTGLASSIQCAARALCGRDRSILIAGTDQPRLSLPHLLLLRDTFPTNANVVTQYKKGAMGIPVRVSAATLAKASELSGDKGFRNLWADLPPKKIEAPELLEDLDTPDQMAEAVKAGWIDPPA